MSQNRESNRRTEYLKRRNKYLRGIDKILTFLNFLDWTFK